MIPGQLIPGVRRLGTDKNGITSWITDGDDLAAKPMFINWDKIDFASKATRLSALDRLKMVADAKQHYQDVLRDQKNIINPIDRDIQLYSSWQPTAPSALLMNLAKARGYTYVCDERGHRFVKLLEEVEKTP